VPCPAYRGRTHHTIWQQVRPAGYYIICYNIRGRYMLYRGTV
jgi:hypothetical protein